MRTPSVLAVPCVVLLALLTGCTVSSGSVTRSSEACHREATTSQDVTNFATVAGEVGAPPVVDLRTPVSSRTTEFADVVVGDGERLVGDSQGFLLDAMLYLGDSGEPIIASAYDRTYPGVATLAGFERAYPGLSESLRCATARSRVVSVIGTDGGISEAVQQSLLASGLGPGAIVAVVDVGEVFLPHAEGTLQFNQGTGLPSVVRAPDGRPGITLPAHDPPSEPVVQTLIAGHGDVIRDDETPIVHYTAVVWQTGAEFGSTWTTGTPVPLPAESDPATMGFGQPEPVNLQLPAFGEALRAATVGSQIMAVVPTDSPLGPTVPEGSTVVVVADIVGATDATFAAG